MTSTKGIAMRLHLHVHRNGLPLSRVLWTLGNSTTTSSTNWNFAQDTVAQLLESINDTIPLESTEWGLEDYTVEVRGFECLHFHEVSAVLRDGDEVHIRPLSTTDLRARKLSGRHQISYDGKHLIDGVAFGRPFFRPSAERPAISIPPRKRRRLVYDGEDEENVSPTMALRQFHGGDLLEDGLADNGEEDDDFEPDNEMDDDDGDFEIYDEGADVSESETGEATAGAEDPTEENREEAGRELVRLSPAGEVADSHATRYEQQPPSRRSKRLKSGSAQGLASALGLLDEHGHAFPAEHHHDPLNQPDKHRASTRKSARASSKNIKPHLEESSRKELPNGQISSAAKRRRILPTSRQSPQSTPGSSKSVRFEGIEVAPDSLPLEPSDHDDSDEDFQLNEGLDAKEPAMDADETSSSGTSADESDSSVSSMSTSSSSSESESSGSESESDSDLEAEQKTAQGQTTSMVPHSARRRDTAGKQPNASPYCPPGEGQKETKKRNERRRRQRKMSYLKRIGALPQNATLTDFDQWKLENSGTDSISAQNEHTGKTAGADRIVDFETKRHELLTSLDSGGVDMTEHIEKPSSLRGLENHMTEGGVPRDAERTPQSALLDESEPAPSDSARSDSDAPRARPKLDVASTKRMLFGSLGLRAPKTRQEEIKLRQKLAGKPTTTVKDTPGHIKFDECGKAVVHRSEDEVRSHNENGTSLGSEAPWRRKLVLSAIECEDEGVELSEPPFPFVQRWDSQYNGPRAHGKRQGISGKKRKRKSSQQYGREQQFQNGSVDNVTSLDNSGVTLNYNDRTTRPRAEMESRKNSDEVDGAVQDQVLRDAAESLAAAGNTDMEDLPPVPSNPSACPILKQSELEPGLKICFKQLMMSPTWQPEISGFRSAIVDQILDDGTIQMTLAERDRERKEVTFDEATGEKVYGKFEMPDEEAEDAAANGFLELSFSELIEPFILQAPVPGASELACGGKLQNGAEGCRDEATAGESQSAEMPKQIGTPEPEDPSNPIEDVLEVDQSISMDEVDHHKSPVCGDGACETPEEGDTPQVLETDFSDLISPRFYGLDSSPPQSPSSRLEENSSVHDQSSDLPLRPTRSEQEAHTSSSPPPTKIAAPFVEAVSSDSEFPSVEMLFSTARTSLDTPKKEKPGPEDPSYTVATQESPLRGSPKLNGHDPYSDPPSEEASRNPKPTQMMGTVDLTFSSDALAPAETVTDGTYNNINTDQGNPQELEWIKADSSGITKRASRRLRKNELKV
ncbi:MAG: hypothetical protein M1837_007066 [Sclerophora amabilis]|nr:MAG: hypothetical protein M1837_007066 [Sclerophora amabilis]